MGQYSDLKNVSDQIHLSGGSIDLLIGIDFVEVSLISTVSGKPGEPIAKRRCFGWYVMGQFESNGSTLFEIQSIEEATVSVVEDIKKLLYQDQLGVKPTTLCTCTESMLDSSTILSWIRTPSRQFKAFVSARVAEIQEIVGVEDFR